MGEAEALDLLLKGLQVAEAVGSVSAVIQDINAKKASGMTAQQISDYLDTKLDQDEAKLRADIDKMGSGVG